MNEPIKNEPSYCPHCAHRGPFEQTCAGAIFGETNPNRFTCHECGCAWYLAKLPGFKPNMR